MDNNNSLQQTNSPLDDLSRRDFLSLGLKAGAGLVVGGLLGGNVMRLQGQEPLPLVQSLDTIDDITFDGFGRLNGYMTFVNPDDNFMFFTGRPNNAGILPTLFERGNTGQDMSLDDIRRQSDGIQYRLSELFERDALENIIIYTDGQDLMLHDGGQGHHLQANGVPGFFVIPVNDFPGVDNGTSLFRVVSIPKLEEYRENNTLEQPHEEFLNNIGTSHRYNLRLNLLEGLDEATKGMIILVDGIPVLAEPDFNLTPEHTIVVAGMETSTKDLINAGRLQAVLYTSGERLVVNDSGLNPRVIWNNNLPSLLAFQPTTVGGESAGFSAYTETQLREAIELQFGGTNDVLYTSFLQAWLENPVSRDEALTRLNTKLGTLRVGGY